MPEGAFGSVGMCTLFMDLMSAVALEPLIRRSPRGQMVGELLEYMQHLEKGKVTGIAVFLLSELSACLGAGNRHKLPSLAQAAVWSAFHKLRARTDIMQAWTAFVTSKIPTTYHKESELALQILLDRGLKKIMTNISESAEQLRIQVTKDNHVKPLTLMESNAVRYMSGYVAIKLLKKYRRRYKNPNVQLKHELFVHTLTRMKAQDQPGDPDSPLEYSTLWLELVDRGGLYHINDDVFLLMESIEMVVRRYLNIPTFVPGTDLTKTVREEILLNHNIVVLWERIADDIPPRFEGYSIELLTLIIDLWVTIRSNSFAKGWTMNFEKRYKKGTRKTLQPAEK